MLAQMRLTLPTTTPDVLPCGMTRVRAYLNRGNDFGWNQTQRGENPDIRRFMIDGEHTTIAAEIEHGIACGWSAGIRLPLQSRGALFMDGIIDWFHNLTGFQDNIRSAFINDIYRIEGILTDGRPFSWNDARGWGFGNMELSTTYALKRPCCRDDWRVSAIGRVGLPTGTGPFARDGIDLGAQLVAAKRVYRCVDIYAGFGGTWFSGTTIRDVEYEPFRWNAFMAVEWRPAHDWSFFAARPLREALAEALRRHPQTGARRFIVPFQKARSEHKFYFETWQLDQPLPDYIEEV